MTLADNLSDMDELPGLTPKQMAFVQALLRGKTASDAYREAYDCEGMAANSIWVAASRLRSDAKVALWLRRYQLATLQEGRVTLEAHLGELTRLRERALDAKQVAAAVQAEHHRGKVAGLYEDRLRITHAPSVHPPQRTRHKERRSRAATFC